MAREIVFISHSSSDAEFTKKLAKDLRDREVNVWLDIFDIPPSSDWNACIQDALARSTFMLVIWSKASVISPEVLSEVFQAKAEGKQIIQIYIDDCKRPAQFNRLQNIDFRQDYTEAFGTLLSFLPTLRKKERLVELQQLLPHNPYPMMPQFSE